MPLLFPGIVGCGPSPVKPAKHAEPIEIQRLVVGDQLPEIEAAGWFNGPPPAIGLAADQITVVDLWADS